MKKFFLFAAAGVVLVVGVLGFGMYQGKQANATALEQVRGADGVVVLAVNGMT